MRVIHLSFLSLFFIFTFLLQREQLSEALTERQEQLANYPPRGWNSYDAFRWTATEEDVIGLADIIARYFAEHGYQYIVVDYLWYRKNVKGASTNSLGFDVIDEWGRVIPDPGRWPSSKGGKGFTEVAKQVHAMGLKFGIHVMRGISTQAVNANTLILDTVKGGAYEESGRKWRAKDIALTERKCAWMDKGFMSVNTKLGAGRAFLRSLYQQYADWGVDFVKHDCVFGDDLDINEIRVVSEVLEELNRPILYSLSSRTSVTPGMAKDVSNLVNMYRVTGADGYKIDKWEDLEAHFNVTRDFAAASMLGAKGLKGKSWPDFSMIPLDWIQNPGPKDGNLTLDEQRTQMTLWCMAKSPLMIGGDLRAMYTATLDLLTEPTLMEINSFSTNNMQFPYITGRSKLTTDNITLAGKRAKANVDIRGIRSWIATGRKGEIYLAFFNLSSEKLVISANVSDLAKAFPNRNIRKHSCTYREVWSKRNRGSVKEKISLTVNVHGCALFVLKCNS